MFCIKCGMSSEATVARNYSPGALVIDGQQDVASLDKLVPADCTGIISFGLNGGLRKILPVVGQTIIASELTDGHQTRIYQPDQRWVQKLYLKTRFYCQRTFSNGKFNLANTPDQRAYLFQQTGAWVIDDESYYVAKFAEQRNIPYAIMRTVSDDWNDDVEITSEMLSSTGGINISAVIKGMLTQPVNMFRIWQNYRISMASLEYAAKLVGPTFEAP